ncbi:hypothetical protein Tco_0684046, partial [Tanacetum coccineum]
MEASLRKPSKHKHGNNAAFYNKPFTFVETEKDIRDLVASPFTAQIRDYDMPDGLKVLMNLKTYDGTSDPDDHLTIFMGTMDVHQLPEPAWCRFFRITLCGAARFWYDNLPKQAHNFIRADKANIKNRLRASRWANNRRGQSYRDTSRRPRDRHTTRPNGRPGECSNTYRPSFTPLLKSPAKIYATLEGKSFLRPLSRMFVLAHRKDRTRYCEFHNDHDHDTNDYVDLQKEIEMYVRNGRLSHLARGAKAQNNSQNATPSSIAKKVKDQVDWKQKIVETKAVNEVLITNEKWSPACHESRTSQPSTNIAFSNDDPISKHCNGDNPLIIKAYIEGCMIHRIYMDGESQLLSPLRIITNPLTLFDYNGKGSKTIMTYFMIVRAPSPYNVILGWPGMRQLGAIASTVHSLIKFPIQSGITIVRRDILRKIKCAQISRKRVHESDKEAISETQEKHFEKENVVINASYQDQPVAIGADLSPRYKEEVRRILSENLDVFAWSPSDMTGIPRELTEHKLNIHPRNFPIRQKNMCWQRSAMKQSRRRLPSWWKHEYSKKCTSLGGLLTQY